MKTALILTDLRLKTLLIGLSILKLDKEANVITSKIFVSGLDYTNFGYQFWRRAKLLAFQILARRKIVYVQSEVSTEIELRGVKASLVSATRDLDAREAAFPYLWSSYLEQSRAAASVCKYVLSQNYGLIYIFNGRFASSRPLYNIASKGLVSARYYEWRPINRFYLSVFQPHMYRELALATIARLGAIRAAGEFPADEEILAEMHSKLHNKFSGPLLMSVKENYDVCIFLSSPHEIRFQVDSYLDDISFIDKVVKGFPNSKICVRSHPNQLSSPSWRKDSALIEHVATRFGLTYYAPDSGVNSHELIVKSKVVCVNYSSMVVDSIFCGNMNVFAFGRSIYYYFLKYLRSHVAQEQWPKTLAVLLLILRDFDVRSMDPSIYIIYRLFWRLEFYLNKRFVESSEHEEIIQYYRKHF
jgi:hypothetical protein